MRKIFLIGIISFIALLFIGCASRSDLTAISSKNVNLSNIKLDRKKILGRAIGENCEHIIILVPTGQATLDEALDRALEAKQANLLLDAVVNWHFFYIPYIYGRECWNVEGDAYDTYQ